MQPPIQYAKAADGVSVAYWASGTGVPFVDMPPIPYSHAQLEWEFAEIASWYKRLASRYRVVRYDARGTGLTERRVSGLSLDAFVFDLEAVLDALALPQVVLFAAANSGPVAITYAARHPERVAGLILWCTWTRGEQFFATTQTNALIEGVLDQDWPLFTEAMAHVRMGWAAGEPAHRFAQLIRESVSPDVQRLVIEALDTADVTELLPSLSTPTLVVHRRDYHLVDPTVARSIAANIPGAVLSLLDGAAAGPYLGNTDAVHAEIDGFLGTTPSSPLPPSGPAHAGLQAVLFTDLVGHTNMMQTLGDLRGREVLREHERITRDILAHHDGIEIKTMGDGFMASFRSVSRALECAIELQRTLARRNGDGAEPLRIRVGLNAGEPIQEDGDLFGATVILAARVAAQASAGEILLPEPVRHLLVGKSFLFADRGLTALKGFEDPVRLFEARWQD